MNNLSTRLYKALQQPTFSSQKKSSSFYPSSASIKVRSELGGTKTVGTCLRQQYYRMKGLPVTNIGVPDWAISALIGNKLHDLITELIDEHGHSMGLQKLSEEHSFYDDRINLSGRSDLIVWDYTINEPIGIEVKSVGEYKASKCTEEPDPQHILQAMLYLDYYQTAIPSNQLSPKKWYILYISRTENWAIKSKKHGGPLQMCWDFNISLDEDGTAIVQTPAGTEKWNGYNIKELHRRYEELQRAVDCNIIPERDYELEYPEQKYVALYKADLLTRKADKLLVDKWLSKGAKKGELKLSFGDFECKMCSWQDTCWNNSSTNYTERPYNLPEKPQKSEHIQKDNSHLLM